MRTIKFRGKEVEDNEWGYGYLFQLGSRTLILEPTESMGFDGKMRPDYYELDVDPKTVGQFAGLFDKNGKEIYEGDIAQEEPTKRRFVVEYLQKEQRFVVRIVGSNQWYGFPYYDLSVIGNIHDNPELMQDKQRNER